LAFVFTFDKWSICDTKDTAGLKKFFKKPNIYFNILKILSV